MAAEQGGALSDVTLTVNQWAKVTGFPGIGGVKSFEVVSRIDSRAERESYNTTAALWDMRGGMVTCSRRSGLRASGLEVQGRGRGSIVKRA
jgi:hypothetical protein